MKARTPEQVERARARWRRAKAAQRARARGQQTASSAPPRTPACPPRGPATPVLRASGDWRARGACKREDPRLFDGETPEDVAAAQRICAGCPVRAECLGFATECGAGHGVWGGVHLGAVVTAVAS